MISMLVGRCHVGERDSAVLRYVVSRLKDGKQTWRGISRERRREIVGEVVREHRENRQLYVDVMSGRIGR